MSPFGFLRRASGTRGSPLRFGHVSIAPSPRWVPAPSDHRSLLAFPRSLSFNSSAAAWPEPSQPHASPTAPPSCGSPAGRAACYHCAPCLSPCLKVRGGLCLLNPGCLPFAFVLTSFYAEPVLRSPSLPPAATRPPRFRKRRLRGESTSAVSAILSLPLTFDTGKVSADP